MFVCAFRLYPAFSGLVRRCGRVCLGSDVSCAPPFLAGSPGVCVCVRAPPVPHQSWLGFVVRVSRFRFCFSPCLSRLGCWGVCVCVRAPPVPRQFWRGYAVWVCVLGFGSGAAPPFLAGVLGFVCLGACSACTPPILAWVFLKLCQHSPGSMWFTCGPTGGAAADPWGSAISFDGPSRFITHSSFSPELLSDETSNILRSPELLSSQTLSELCFQPAF